MTAVGGTGLRPPKVSLDSRLRGNDGGDWYCQEFRQTHAFTVQAIAISISIESHAFLVVKYSEFRKNIYNILR
jgi:hypothetical protein